MQQLTPEPAVATAGSVAYVQWGPVIAGALAAAAVSFVLIMFASALGLAVFSPSPTWRDTSAWLAILSGFWVLLVDVASFALGGYIAGRTRTAMSGASDAEVEFRDGAHGLLTWALAVVIGALLLWATATALSSVAAGTAAARSTPGEPAFLAFELDKLLRRDGRPIEGNVTETRAEAGRIIMSGLGRRGIAPEDRAYLVRLVSARTGLPAADAERRVTEVLAQSARAARQARRSAVIIGFITAAALLAAAAAAWLAAIAGGRHRDGASAPPLRWEWSDFKLGARRPQWP